MIAGFMPGTMACARPIPNHWEGGSFYTSDTEARFHVGLPWFGVVEKVYRLPQGCD
jgi:hypothetical protein